MRVPPGEAPLIVGIGGSPYASSSTERALALALAEADRLGARTLLIGGECIARLPHYLTPDAASSSDARDMVEAIRLADGLVIASPSYHGSISGLIKNAIDYLEETAHDARPYLTDLPVGLIAVASGNQAATATLLALRTIVHALRGWPTPFGATINTSGGMFDNGICKDAAVETQLRLVGAQVEGFVTRSAGQANIVPVANPAPEWRTKRA